MNTGHNNACNDIYHQGKKYFQLEMFPYPSGAGLHLGHAVGYTGSDIRVRFLRLFGYDVLYTMGFDSFGLPAEQFALQTGQHPEITTKNNINNMIQQLKNLQLSYDWSKSLSTTDPEYYKWTQWIFLQIYNSFFDHTEIWTDRFGHTIKGKAKHIDVLKQYLKDNIWCLDENGIPVPTAELPLSMHKRQYTEKEIDDAIDKKRLAYLDDALVNWCPKLGTVLANEEVTPDGTSERGGFPVETKYMKQWMMRITDYAERLSDGFDKIDWPEKTVVAQKNWIGLKTGYKIKFQIENTNEYITIFTTKPETIIGVTFIAIAQEYPKYGISLEAPAADQSDQNNLQDDKVGKFTGIYAIHPLTKQKIPVWSANYVLMEYGMGAVMGVPDGDERDRKFAEKYNLPSAAVFTDESQQYIANPSENVSMQHYSLFKALPELIPIAVFINILRQNRLIIPHNTCKLRNWLFSRQRYWGEPFPIVYCAETGKVYPIDESELPVTLPYIDFDTLSSVVRDHDEIFTPLSTAKEWVNVKGIIVDGTVKILDHKQITTIDPSLIKAFYRETNTMPNWAGSCWYYLRYMDPNNTESACSVEAQQALDRQYASADYYIGGSEHTVLHLLYARFWHMFLYDMGFVISPEPFMSLRHQGMINAYSFRRDDYRYVHPEQVKEDNGVYYDMNDNAPVTKLFGKMGKSFNNSIDPDEFVQKYGNDVLRAFIHFMGPFDHDKVWTTDGISGIQKFFSKVEKMIMQSIELSAPSHITSAKIHTLLTNLNHYAIDAYQEMKFNTLLAKCMEFVNAVLQDDQILSIQDAKHFLIILHPIAINMTDQLYQLMKTKHANVCQYSHISEEKWPIMHTEGAHLASIKIIRKNKVLVSINTSMDILDQINQYDNDMQKIQYIYDFLQNNHTENTKNLNKINANELIAHGQIYIKSSNIFVKM